MLLKSYTQNFFLTKYKKIKYILLAYIPKILCQYFKHHIYFSLNFQNQYLANTTKFYLYLTDTCNFSPT